MITYLGLICILLSWLAGWYLLTKWRDKDFMSISRHASSSPFTMGLFAAVLIGVGCVLYGWLWFWLAPRLGLGWIFYVVLILACVFQVATAVVPDLPGWRRKAHKWAAWGMAAWFLPMAWLVALAPGNSIVGRCIGVVLSAYMTVGWGLIFAGKLKETFLIFQASYIISVQIVILAAAYI